MLTMVQVDPGFGYGLDLLDADGVRHRLGPDGGTRLRRALIGSLYKIANGLDVPLSVLLSQQPVFSAEDATDALAKGGRIDLCRAARRRVSW
jgi:hypothetical protein